MQIKRSHLKRCIPILISVLTGLLAFGEVRAQPSGGPYGPIPQTYKLPETDGRIYYVAPHGAASVTGESPDNPTTLEAALKGVVTGDAIVMRGGTYRTGNLQLNQGITMQPYKDEQPVLKGTLEAKVWEKLPSGLWRTNWSHLFPTAPAGWWNRERNLRFTPLHRFNDDMVFVDGRFLQSAGKELEVNENTFYIDYDSEQVYIGVDPTDKLIEITAFNLALERITGECHGKKPDKIGPKIRGITFTQYAYRALEIEGTEAVRLTDESLFGKDVIGTLLEHCEISFCSRVAGYLRGDSMVIRHCKVSDTSTEGIYLISSSDCLLEKNIFTRNNIEQITGYYPAGVKIFNQTHRVICRDNLITDHPYSNGIWYDVGNRDGIFINNLVRHVGLNEGEISYNSIWHGQNGFFFEISKGAVCAGNVFVDCDNGILVLNSSNVSLYQNTLVNSMLVIARDERSAVGDHFGWHPSTGPDVDERYGHILVNNLMTAGENYHRPLLMIWQPRSLCEELPDPPLSLMDHNVYVRSAASSDEPLILWSPGSGNLCQEQLDNPEGLHAIYPAFEGNSKYFKGYSAPLFTNEKKSNYALMGGFPGSAAGTTVPEDIKVLLGLDMDVKPYVGAYPRK